MRSIAILRAVLTNILAGLAPRFFMKLVGETGRGGDCADLDALSAYCRHVVDDYERIMALGGIEPDGMFKDKVILEYGPGDFLGVALLLIAKGAKKVYCVDRFPLAENAMYKPLYDRMASELPEKNAWEDLFGTKIVYLASKNGLYDLSEKADIVLSRAVLEHCNDLPQTFENMKKNLDVGGLIIHKVDLTSHGTHYRDELDFLCYSPFVWKIMTSFKGYPNRARRPRYIELLTSNRFCIRFSESRYDYSDAQLDRIRPKLHRVFNGLNDEDLLCSDYFFIPQSE